MCVEGREVRDVEREGKGKEGREGLKENCRENKGRPGWKRGESEGDG